jgi:1-pyrroline-5-carboxylate dehydrogenase
MAEEGFRITYATMTADNEDLHKGYEEGIEIARSWLGKQHPLFVNGEAREGSGYKAAHSPIDGALIGEFASGTREDVRDAVAAAKEAFHDWANRPWQERVAIIRKAADVMSDQRNELSALMAMEVGKNRLEALGDVEESADLLRWNANEVEQNEGFRTPMQSLGSPGEYYDVLRPYGVWAVISPFNFPMALAAGPSSAALVAGNTVVFKPAHMGVFTGLKLYEVYMAAGVPKGVFHFLSGPGSVVGDEIVNHPDVAGITFTGSYEVGMGIYKGFAKDFPKPVICEMGGKNPAIVTDKADLDKATDGVLRSAFGFGGQKCSANSRVYVHRSVYDEFVQRLKEKTEDVKIGDPLDRDVYLGPVIDDAAVATFEEASNEAKKNGTVITGGDRLTEGDLAKGTFVQPTIAEVPLDSWIWKKELFVPFVAVAPYDDLDDAIRVGMLQESDVPEIVLETLGATHGQRINSLVTDAVECNRERMTTTSAVARELELSDDVLSAANTLRDFLFDRVYAPINLLCSTRQAESIVESLFSYYCSHPDELPADVPTFADDPAERHVADVISGMTDRFAVACYERRFRPLAEEL